MPAMFRRALPYLFLLALGLILFLPRDILDRSGDMVLASGWFGADAATPAKLSIAPPA
jgi:hypothetical protein